MTVRVRDLVGYLDATLEIDRFRDYGPNGLQVEGGQEVDCVVTAVSSSLALFERAAELEADLVVVHHGIIWGPGLADVTGPTARRLVALLSNGISLAAYHLPLDAHKRLGNNVGLAAALGIEESSHHWFGDVRGHALGLAGSWAQPLSRADALALIGERVLGGAAPQFVFPFGPDPIRKVGMCTGAASDLLLDASRQGCDLFITGELAERAAEMARELQITLVAAGHYATEVFGPMRIAEELRLQFPEIRVQFVDLPTPL